MDIPLKDWSINQSMSTRIDSSNSSSNNALMDFSIFSISQAIWITRSNSGSIYEMEKICLLLQRNLAINICLFPKRPWNCKSHGKRHNGNGAINSILMQSQTPMQRAKATSPQQRDRFLNDKNLFVFFLLLQVTDTQQAALVPPSRDLLADRFSISLSIWNCKFLKKNSFFRSCQLVSVYGTFN